MNIDFKNKKILVTGGTRGIGAEIALRFSKNNGDVYITGTEKSSFEKFKESYPNTAIKFIKVDFSNLGDVEQFLEKVSTMNIDVLINNAGINKLDSLENINITDWQKIQDINVRAPMLISQAVTKSMIQKKWGRIVNIASVFGVVTKEKRMSYTASKAALVGMTKTMALDLAGYNILANAVSPGFIDTELTRTILGEDGIKEMVSKVPLQRLGTPTDVSNLVLYLSSAENGFITGQNIIIDGGFTCA